MVKPVVTKTRYFCFTLTGSVGTGQPNHLDDVEFVRFGLIAYRVGSLARGKVNVPGYNDFLLATVSLPATGGMDSHLDRAIRGFQKSQELKVDGIVSASPQRVAPSGKYYSYAYFDFAMREQYPRLYPRVDLVPESGPAFSRAITEMFVVDSPSGKMQLL